MSNITIEKIGEGAKYNVFFRDSTKIGQFILDVDGYYHYWPPSGDGSWDDYILIEIGTALKELNKPHNNRIDDYFKNKELW